MTTAPSLDLETAKRDWWARGLCCVCDQPAHDGLLGKLEPHGPHGAPAHQGCATELSRGLRR